MEFALGFLLGVTVSAWAVYEPVRRLARKAKRPSRSAHESELHRLERADCALYVALGRQRPQEGWRQ